MATHPPQTPRGDGNAGNNPPIANAEIDAEIGRLRGTVEPPIRNRQDEILDRLIVVINGLQDRMDRMEINSNVRENFRLTGPNDRPESLNATYGRTQNDVRELINRPTGYLHLKDARRLIPEVDGSQRHKTQEFISASTYAMEKIDLAERSALLEEILNTKLKGKLLLDFQIRSIQDFEQLRREIEINYLGRRGTSHLQLEFNALKQKTSESAHT
ncbi:hypothetical protein ALC62_12439 [Cyphomyrmex costatus]|uniref:Uncharacterized protein n=1 Tax=Cyphomyrmex costatus TaxID=456900 RepID=A0A151IB79_9HYME|nr:hypothetical protein ALC62_12439 [Cyphomyrmex costatus]